MPIDEKIGIVRPLPPIESGLSIYINEDLTIISKPICDPPGNVLIPRPANPPWLLPPVPNKCHGR